MVKRRWGPWSVWYARDGRVPPVPPEKKPPRDLVIASVDGCWLTWYGPDPDDDSPRRRSDGERRPVVAVYVRSPVPPPRPLS